MRQREYKNTPRRSEGAEIDFEVRCTDCDELVEPIEQWKDSTFTGECPKCGKTVFGSATVDVATHLEDYG